MFRKIYWKIYSLINEKIRHLSFRLSKDKSDFLQQEESAYNRRIGDVYFDKITKKTWRIIHIFQDDLGDLDYIIRDDKGRVRAIKDYYLDEGFVKRTKTWIRSVHDNEKKLDADTYKRIDVYFEKRRKEFLKTLKIGWKNEQNN